MLSITVKRRRLTRVSEWTFMLCALNLGETFQIWREKCQTLRLMCAIVGCFWDWNFHVHKTTNQESYLHGSLQQLKNSSFVVRKRCKEMFPVLLGLRDPKLLWGISTTDLAKWSNIPEIIDRVMFKIMSTSTLLIVRHEVQFLTNHIHNKSRDWPILWVKKLVVFCISFKNCA